MNCFHHVATMGVKKLVEGLILLDVCQFAGFLGVYVGKDSLETTLEHVFHLVHAVSDESFYNLYLF